MGGGDLWARWRPEFAKACDGSHQTIESIERELANGHTCLLARDDHAYIVSIERYPSAVACQVWWGAGNLDALVSGLHELHKWARANGCTEMLIEGNPGWKRALAALDYTLFSVTLRRPL